MQQGPVMRYNVAHWCAAIGFVFTAVVSGLTVHGQEQPLTPPAKITGDLTGELSGDLDIIMGGQSSGIHIAPRLMPVMSRADFIRYVQWCVLSEEQAVFVWAMFDAYIDEYSAAIRQNMPKMVALSQDTETAMAKHGVLTTQFFEAYKEFITHVNDINKRCDDAAETCFTRIKSVLKEEQLRRFERVELDRARRRVNLTDRMHHTSCVDLIKLIEQLGFDEASIATLEPVMMEYERKITPLVVKNEKCLTERQIPLSQAYSILNMDLQGRPLDPTSPTTPAIYEQNIKRVTSILRESAEFQDAILRVNKDFVPQIAAILVPEDAARFHAAYKSKAYRLIYPDRYDPQGVYELVVSYPNLPVDVQESIRVEWGSYRQHYDLICDEMEKECERYYFQLAATESEPIGDPFREKIKQGKDDRLALSQQMMKRFREILPAEQLAVFQRRLELEEEVIATVRATAQEDH